MTLDTDVVLREIDDVFARCGASADQPFVPKEHTSAGPATVRGNRGLIASSALACIERNAPQQSYVEQARTLAAGDTRLTQGTLDALLGILAGVRRDIEAGYGRALESRARDEVFSDFLDAAEYIVKTNAAAGIVLAVSVLEEHVRKLAEAKHIATVKANGNHASFEDLTAGLLAAEVLNRNEKKLATGWYGQRTDAAHGRFETVVVEEAPRIVASVRDFIARHPA